MIPFPDREQWHCFVIMYDRIPTSPFVFKTGRFGDLLCQHQEIDSNVEFKISHKLFSEDFRGRFSSRDAEKTGRKSYSCMEEKGGEGIQSSRGDRSQRDGTETESNLDLRKKLHLFILVYKSTKSQNRTL